jgi:hypothetical protein
MSADYRARADPTRGKARRPETYRVYEKPEAAQGFNVIR